MIASIYWKSEVSTKKNEPKREKRDTVESILVQKSGSGARRPAGPATTTLEQLVINRLFNEQLVINRLFHEQLVINRLFNEQLVINRLFNEQLVINILFNEQLVINRLINEQLVINRLYHEQSKQNSLLENLCPLQLNVCLLI